MPIPRISSSLVQWYRIDSQIRAIDARLAQLETAPQKPRSRLARIFGGLAPAWPQLLSSMVMLVVGFAVKDSVDLAIRQQQLQQSFAVGARLGLEQMSKEGADPETTKQAAVVVAAFGAAAVMPLVNELRAGGNRAIGAEAGLSALSLTEPGAVCQALRRALSHSSQYLNAEAYMATVRTLALADCVDALEVLRRHLTHLRAALIPGTEATVRLMEPRPTPQQLKSAVEEVTQTITLLEAVPVRRWNLGFSRSEP